MISCGVVGRRGHAGRMSDPVDVAHIIPPYLLQHLAEGRTTIAIAHRLSTAARADRVLVLHDGRLVEDGHHDELVGAGGTYTRLYDAWLSATTAS